MKRLGAVAAASVLVLLAIPGVGLAKKNKPKAPDGAKLFAQNCAYCHGNGGRGDGPNSQKLTPPPADLTKSRASESDIAGVVKNGKGSCPSWRASFSDAEVAAVASYAKNLQR